MNAEIRIAGITYSVNEIRTDNTLTLPGAGMITSSIINKTERGVSAYVNVGGRTFFKNCANLEDALAWLQKQYDDFGNIFGFTRFRQFVEKGARL